MDIENHSSLEGWWSDASSIQPFVRFRDCLTDEVFFTSSKGHGLHVTVSPEKEDWEFDMSEGSYPGVTVELCLPRFAQSPQVIGMGTLLLDDVIAVLARGLGQGSLVVPVWIEEALRGKKNKSRKEKKASSAASVQVPAQTRGPVLATEPRTAAGAAGPATVERLVGKLTIYLREYPENDPVWARSRVKHWKTQGLPSLPTLTHVHKALQTCTAAPDRTVLLSIIEQAEASLLSMVDHYGTWNGEGAEKELSEVLGWFRKLEANLNQNEEVRRLSAPDFQQLGERLASSVLSQAPLADHELQRAALKFACDVDPHLPEVATVERSFKALLRFPRDVKLHDLLNASEADAVRLEPSDFGLELASEGTLASISDSARFGVRDATVRRVLKMLGCTTELNHRDGGTFSKLAMEAMSAHNFQVKQPVQALMADAKLFIGARVARKCSICELLASSDRDWEALIGRFDVVAVPSRADYDDHFQQRKEALSCTFFGESPCEPIGGPGWFWVFHAAAINIGESERADDFQEYSMAPDIAYRGRHGHRRWLDEERYVADMGTLWRRTLLSARHLSIEDMVMFPFGMGAFLRNLHKLDLRYSDPAAIRRLRYRVALGLFEAAADICVNDNPPMCIHLCLVETSLESRSNHNVFIEAAAAKVKEVPELANLVKIHRNCDALEMAHTLACKVPGRPDMDISVRKVGLFNGANNKQLGNHWFSNGARNAIDENLHRRSGAMSVSSLLLNLSTEPRKRNRQELATHIEVLGGDVVELLPLPIRAQAASSTSLILAKVRVVPYGVLGTQCQGRGELRQVAPEPSFEEVFTDPAGLPYIQSSPSGAGGASGTIYRFLGISSDPEFPEPVRTGITEPGMAKFHVYGDKKVIHVVGPNFQSRPRCSYSDAVSELAQAYCSTLTEFVDSGERRLRLLPISSSIFAGHFEPQMPQMTMEALHQGFSMLDAAAQDSLLAAESLEMCIFMETDFQQFQEAFRSS
eukprot:TRINITY_DN72380_c0_g1_i1.p1 TRINITY_DN72380_c0_g1~~TRINITY_DN72380_c0_g1_i1.p1  ORF type:complete len:1090 (-),score=170.08 TRINITY_DN72380_c0_g1_i1:131-3079(-)